MVCLWLVPRTLSNLISWLTWHFLKWECKWGKPLGESHHCWWHPNPKIKMLRSEAYKEVTGLLGLVIWNKTKMRTHVHAQAHTHLPPLAFHSKFLKIRWPSFITRFRAIPREDSVSLILSLNQRVRWCPDCVTFLLPGRKHVISKHNQLHERKCGLDLEFGFVCAEALLSLALRSGGNFPMKEEC